ncbi:hypothetical protein SAG0136_07900 [Streptococcus agalactiae LMG 14747]|uniref:Uncharacterized protein n=1 Tax=Streptococcus agalactiae LMG 14747 TaxID=1154860 RepID=V6Z328_STRAG|nr:hypothetical protein SAG0136_07900 [Streptococcus agalactiae LMG 14747]
MRPNRYPYSGKKKKQSTKKQIAELKQDIALTKSLIPQVRSELIHLISK